MIFDMHCHTKEGSIDAKAPAYETAKILKEKGYDGMLITDHDSYKGYDYISKIKLDFNFTILRGIEYDTSNGGHILIILPTGINGEEFCHRGLTIKNTIKLVHDYGGILGPAHPFDYSRLGIGNTKCIRDINLLKSFDFLETFNGSLFPKTQILSQLLAKTLNKPCFGGSDSHFLSRVGMGKTNIPVDIKSESDLIRYIKNAKYEENQAYGEFVERISNLIHSLTVNCGGFLYSVLNSISKPHHKFES